MDILHVLKVLQDLSPLGVIALLGASIFMLVFKNPLKPIETSLDEVKTNHLHELPELVENSRRAVEVLQRIEVNLSGNFAIINTKLDEK